MSSSSYLAKLSVGVIKVSGVDAKKLMQGQFTCDIEKIDTTQACLGAQCNPQGRVISLFYLFNLDTVYYLALPPSMTTITINALKKYAVFYKVDISDVSAEYSCLGYAGDKLQALVLEKNLPIYTFPTPSLRHLTLGPNASIQQCIQSNSDLVLNEDAWKQHDINEGIPSIYPETSALFLPHEINLHLLQGISLEKGCYTGQEIVARMHYLGKLKKQMIKTMVTSNIAPQPGGDLNGQIVDVLNIGQNEYCVLVIQSKTSEAT